jgi:hypothetical protein
MGEEVDTCVFKTNGEGEAQQVKAFLRAHGITAELRGEALRMTHGLTLDGLGVVRVIVAPEQVDEARELLARAESGELELIGDDEPRED